MPKEDNTSHETPKNSFEEPPIGGELWLRIDASIPSLQGKKEARVVFEEKIHELTRKYHYLFSGDIGLDITLQVHQSNRYESDASPDLDNFLKPLLDSLSGPDGIMIDDCQIRTLSINWISWAREDTRIEMLFRVIGDEYVKKQGLLFVQIEGPLCMPVDTTLPLEAQKILFSAMQASFESRRHLAELDWDYYSSSSVLPIQRRFHRTRINSFPVKSIQEYSQQLSLAEG